MKKRLSHLEKEVERLNRIPAPAPSKGETNPSTIMFPSTITINLHKREEDPPPSRSESQTTKNKVKRPIFKKESSQPKSPSKTSAPSDPLPQAHTQPISGPSQTTYIEYLNVEKLVIDRYEQSNNFGALGIKSLEGKLNIGANYADPSQLPKESQEKLKEKLKQAEELKSHKNSGPSEQTSKPPKTTYPFEEFKQIEMFENYFDWDDFFSRQPKDAENNQ